MRVIDYAYAMTKLKGWSCLSSQELAKAMSCSESTVTLLLQGKRQPSIDMLERFCKAVGVSPVTLTTFAWLDYEEFQELSDGVIRNLFLDMISMGYEE